MKRIGALILILLTMFAAESSGGVHSYMPEPGAAALQGMAEKLPDIADSRVKEESLRCLYYDEQEFMDSLIAGGISKADAQSAHLSKGSIKGGILPHHLVASPMIARFFEALKTGDTDYTEPITIVILGPNHKRVGNSPLNTGSFNWDTPFGRLRAEAGMIEGLVNTLGAGVNPRLLEEEHSISALIPYVKYHFPEASIVPVLIHGNLDRNDSRKLALHLFGELKDKPGLVLASIDFSHGLSPQETPEHDRLTQSAIENRDYDAIFRMDNTYLDAPPTLAAFLMLMDHLGAKSGNLLENGEASGFLNKYVPETTSYMTYVFTTEKTPENEP